MERCAVNLYTEILDQKVNISTLDDNVILRVNDNNWLLLTRCEAKSLSKAIDVLLRSTEK